MRKKIWGICLPYHYESECETNLQIFTCNHFCVDGNASARHPEGFTFRQQDTKEYLNQRGTWSGVFRESKHQESPQQTKPKKGPKRKVHEFRPFLCEFWCVFPWENKHDSHWTFVPECPWPDPREASTLIFKTRSCTVRGDLKNKPKITRRCLIFKIRACNARSDLKNKSARFSGILAVSTLELPNADSNFAVDVRVDFVLFFIQWKRP